MSTGCAVEAVSRRRVVATPPASYARGAVVVCAGAWSDRLARALPARPPTRGSSPSAAPTCAFARSASQLVRASVYPVPDPELPFLGAHLTRGPDGSVLLGPTALIAAARDGYRLTRVRAADARETLAWPGTWRLARRFWRAGAIELAHAASRRAWVAGARRLVPELRSRDFEPAFAGVRAQAVARDGTPLDDFLVSRSGRCVHVRNTPSPAATASLALARLIADEVEPLLA